MITPTTPEILAFLLCDQLTQSRFGPCLIGVRQHVPLQRTPETIDQYAYFEVRLPPGVVKIVVEVCSPDGRPLVSRSVPSETAFRGGVKGGSAKLRIPFEEPGIYTARLRVGEVSMERHLCAWTPESRNRFAPPTD